MDWTGSIMRPQQYLVTIEIDHDYNILGIVALRAFMIQIFGIEILQWKPALPGSRWYEIVIETCTPMPPIGLFGFVAKSSRAYLREMPDGSDEEINLLNPEEARDLLFDSWVERL